MYQLQLVLKVSSKCNSYLIHRGWSRPDHSDEYKQILWKSCSFSKFGDKTEFGVERRSLDFKRKARVVANAQAALNLLGYSVKVAHDTLTVSVLVRILLSQPYAGVAELEYAQDLKFCDSNIIRVQIPSPVPESKCEKVLMQCWTIIRQIK